MRSFLLRFVPLALKEKLRGRHNLQKIITNIGWLSLDRIVRMGVGLFVGVWVARYLGPEQFGLLSYALAFAGLFGFASSLGLGGIVIREIVRNPETKEEVLGTSFVLHVFGGLSAFLLAVAVIWHIRPDDEFTKLIVAILGFTFVFKSADVVKYWFESQVQSKYVVWIENGVFLFIVAVKVVLILKEAPLIAFVWAFFADALLVAAGLMLVYFKKAGKFIDWKVKKDRAKALLKDSWPLMLSGLMIAVHMKIDQVMIGEMLNADAVGQYAAAVKVSEVWYFIPVMITASVFPAIINAKKISEDLYYSRLQRLYTLMVWLAIAIALPMTFFSGKIINLLYGVEYAGAGSVLMIHVWAGFNVALGSAWSKWILNENKQKLSLYGYILGAVLNILFNLFLIESFGINGAAIATLLSYWISALFAYALYKPSKSYGLFIRSFNLIRIANEFKRSC